MSKNKIVLNFSAKIEPLTVLNDEFTKCRCYVMALGKNRNFSYFDKTSIEKALPSLFNIPVIGHLIEREDGSRYMGSHDSELIVDGKDIYLKSVCVPYGVVPCQDSIAYETVTEEDGTEVEYLTADVILWTGRFPELKEAVYSENLYFNQSMEVNFFKSNPLAEDKNYTQITDFSFSALCMLGKSDNPDEHTEPCFPSARIEPYQFAVNEEFSKLMREFKQELSFCFENKNNEEGGNEELKFTEEVRDSILAEFEVAFDELDFEIDNDITEEQFREKVSDFACKKKKCALESFSLTYREKREALCSLFPSVVERDAEDKLISETYYYVSDFDDEYVYVSVDKWDSENYTSDYGRQAYTMTAEGIASLSGEFEPMVMKWLTIEENTKLEADRAAYEIMQGEFETYKSEHSVANVEVDELRTFKSETVAKQREDEEANLFAKYEEKLKDFSEFAALKSNAKDFSLDEIENQCLIIAGKNLVNFSKSTKRESQIVKVDFEADDDNRTENLYGGLFEQYGNK